MFNNLQLGLIGYAQKSIQRARANLKIKGFGGQKSNRSKQSTGALGKGLGFTLKNIKDRLVVSFNSKENYGYNVEYGRKKGSMPPTSALEAWIKAKPIRLRKKSPNALSASSSTFAAKTPQSIKSAAYAMAKSIKKRGIKAVPFMSEAARDELNNADEILNLENALSKDVAEIIVIDANKSNSVKAKITN